jgi:benzodiazapine receptor
MNRAWVFPVFIAAMLAGIVALVGATITDTGPWYRALAKPDWAPPDAVYGVAWTAIYACTAIAGVTGWIAAPTRAAREWLLGVFALNCFLNILWSLLFFRLQRPDWALVEVVALWVSVVLLLWVCGRQSRIAAALLLPYLVWVGFAGCLNWSIVQANAPF